MNVHNLIQIVTIVHIIVLCYFRIRLFGTIKICYSLFIYLFTNFVMNDRDSPHSSSPNIGVPVAQLCLIVAWS